MMRLVALVAAVGMSLVIAVLSCILFPQRFTDVLWGVGTLVIIGFCVYRGLKKVGK